MNLNNKTFTVIGLNKTGIPVTKYLAKKGARVIASDIKKANEIQDKISQLKNFDIEFDLGGHSSKSLNTDIIVVSPGVPLDLPFFKEAKKNNIPIISEIELAYRMTEANIVGITGTNGKTTTTSLLGEILNNSYLAPVPVAGNIGTPLIEKIENLTEDNWLVAEISSFQLETIKKFRPDISLFLNFSPDHLDRHGSLEKYYSAKKNIFINQNKNDKAIINIDNKFVKKAADDIQAEIFEISLKKEVKKGMFFKNNSLFARINGIKKEIININDINIKGKHNLYNTAFAVLTALILDVSSDKIISTCQNFKADKHRMEYLASLDDATIFIDDSKATNPHATINALQTINKNIILIAGGEDRKLDFEELAKEIKQQVKHVILIGQTKEKIAKVLKNIGFYNFELADDMREAVSYAVKNLDRGDCLLLSPACPSWDMYESYKKRGQDFLNELKRWDLLADRK
ncbi:MAG: UDP-N-acetylmuramoyl-L-alanine--D-glutamate ligase [Bacillota bacterium]